MHSFYCFFFRYIILYAFKKKGICNHLMKKLVYNKYYFTSFYFGDNFLQDEREDYVAHMWRRVALSSKETLEQLISYQAAIESLTVRTELSLLIY